jgi:hypothetical protein
MHHYTPTRKELQMTTGKKTLSGLIRVAVMAAVAASLVIPAIADNCAYYWAECADGTGDWEQVCCPDNAGSGWAVCNCDSWSADSGYSGCGNYTTGCLPLEY